LGSNLTDLGLVGLTVNGFIEFFKIAEVLLLAYISD
jgi:hypothetical protein